MNLQGNLQKNKELITKRLPSKDVVFFPFLAGEKNALAVYAESLTDKELLGVQAVKSLASAKNLSTLTATTAPQREYSLFPKKRAKSLLVNFCFVQVRARQ